MSGPGARDSRVEKLVAKWGEGLTPEELSALNTPPAKASWDLTLRLMEAAGLVVLDPDDYATVQTIAIVLGVRTARPWNRITGAERGWLRDDARAVLDALRGAS